MPVFVMRVEEGGSLHCAWLALRLRSRWQIIQKLTSAAKSLLVFGESDDAAEAAPRQG